MEKSEYEVGSLKLSKRLKTLAAMVSSGNRLADVGCDHGYIPIALCLADMIPSAIAMDVKEGPLCRAREHISAYGLNDRIETRLSDGIEQLGEDEADTLLIAGMGGLLIRRILTVKDIPAAVKELILAPQSEISEVRRCIRNVGFYIEDEDMVLEDGIFYPIIRAVREPESFAADKEYKSEVPVKEGRQEIEDAFGPVLLRKRNPVLRRQLEDELETTNRILIQLENANNRSPAGDNREMRQRELEHKRELLLSALKEMTDP